MPSSSQDVICPYCLQSFNTNVLVLPCPVCKKEHFVPTISGSAVCPNSNTSFFYCVVSQQDREAKSDVNFITCPSCKEAHIVPGGVGAITCPKDHAYSFVYSTEVRSYEYSSRTTYYYARCPFCQQEHQVDGLTGQFTCPNLNLHFYFGKQTRKRYLYDPDIYIGQCPLCNMNHIVPSRSGTTHCPTTNGFFSYHDLSTGDSKLIGCTHCQAETPIQYLTDCAKNPPVFIQVFGWTNVGKTVFLSALTLMLSKMGKVWSGYSYSSVTEPTQLKLREINQYVTKGTLPEPTRLGPQEAYVMTLKNMARWGGRTLVVRDCAGEIFDSMIIPADVFPFLVATPTTFMFVSIPDLIIGPDRTMDMLLNNYVDASMKRGGDFNTQKRQIVVVLTKADLVPDLPSGLRSYLLEDPIWGAISTRGPAQSLTAMEMALYVARMDDVSSQIRSWLLEEATGANFVGLIADRNIEVRYSLISSLGSPVGHDGKLTQAWSPKRVLDPFLWALELQAKSHD